METINYDNGPQVEDLSLVCLELANDLIDIEHIEKFPDLMELGLQVFGDQEKFINWLNGISPALGGKTPRALIADGKIDEIVDELGRIEYGIFA